MLIQWVTQKMQTTKLNNALFCVSCKYKYKMKIHGKIVFEDKLQTSLTVDLVSRLMKHKLVWGDQCIEFFIHPHSQRYFPLLPPVSIQHWALNCTGKRTHHFASCSATGILLRRRRTAKPTNIWQYLQQQCLHCTLETFVIIALYKIYIYHPIPLPYHTFLSRHQTMTSQATVALATSLLGQIQLYCGPGAWFTKYLAIYH